MSSDTFDVRVRSVEGPTVSFDVLTGTAGGLADCCTSRSFALFLLRDALDRAPDSLPGPRDDAWRAKAGALQARHDASELAGALSGQSWLDAAWMRDNVQRFVAETQLVARRNHLDDDALSARELEIEAAFPGGLGMDVQDQWRPMRWERCHSYTLRVVAADPAWTEHLEVGLEFPTVGYDVWDEAEPAPPPAPPRVRSPVRGTREKSASKTTRSKVQKDAAPADTGFMPVPREIWLPFGIPATTPAMLDAPAYPATDYADVRTLEGRLDADAMRAYHGRALRIGDRPRELEILLVDGTMMHVAKIGVDHVGFSTWGELLPSPVRLVGLKPRAKRTTKLTYPHLLRSISPGLVAAERSGARVVITIRLGPGRALDFLPAARDVLRMIARPLADAQEWGFVRPSPLSDALQSEHRSRDCSSLRELYSTVDATNYVTSYSIEAPPPSEVPPLDAMTEADVRAFFAAPWPTAKVIVQATDAKWVQHLDDLPPLVAVHQDAL